MDAFKIYKHYSKIVTINFLNCMINFLTLFLSCFKNYEM